MNKQFLSLLCFGLMVGLTAPVNADIEFDVDSTTGTTVTAGGSGALQFFLDVSGADDGADADAYTLTVQATAFGGADITDLIVDYGTVANSGPFTIGPFVNTVGGLDTVGGNAFPAIQMTPRTDLFTVNFTVKPTATAVGGYNIDIVGLDGAGLNPTRVDLGGVSLGATFGQSPELSMSFNQIPEPTALGILALGLVGITSTRRRRKVA